MLQTTTPFGCAISLDEPELVKLSSTILLCRNMFWVCLPSQNNKYDQQDNILTSGSAIKFH